MNNTETPEVIYYISCPECDFRRTSDDPKVSRVRLGGEKCPKCGHHYGLEAVVGRYRKEEDLTDVLWEAIERIDSVSLSLAGEIVELENRDHNADDVVEQLDHEHEQFVEIRDWLKARLEEIEEVDV